MIDAKQTLWIVIAGVVGSFALVGLLLGPEEKWRGLAGAGALLFFVAAVVVVARRKARDKREREEQPPVPSATVVREDIEVPEQRPRERELE